MAAFVGSLLTFLIVVAFVLGGDHVREHALKCIEQLTVSHAEFCLGKEKP